MAPKIVTVRIREYFVSLVHRQLGITEANKKSRELDKNVCVVVYFCVALCIGSKKGQLYITSTDKKRYAQTYHRNNLEEITIHEHTQMPHKITFSLFILKSRITGWKNSYLREKYMVMP